MSDSDSVGSDGAPEEFRCSITHQLMNDPVICSDGNSYERAAILRWLDDTPRSPLTNLPMNAVMQRDVELHRQIMRWRATRAAERLAESAPHYPQPQHPQPAMTPSAPPASSVAAPTARTAPGGQDAVHGITRSTTLPTLPPPPVRLAMPAPPYSAPVSPRNITYDGPQPQWATAQWARDHSAAEQRCAVPPGRRLCTCCGALKLYYDPQAEAVPRCCRTRCATMLTGSLVCLLLVVLIVVLALFAHEASDASRPQQCAATQYSTLVHQPTCGTHDIGDSDRCFVDCSCSGGLPVDLLRSYTDPYASSDRSLLDASCGELAASVRPAGITVLAARVAYTFSGAVAYAVSTSSVDLLSGSLEPGEWIAKVLRVAGGFGAVHFQVRHLGEQSAWWNQSRSLPAQDLAALTQVAEASHYAVDAGWAACELAYAPRVQRLFSGRATAAYANTMSIAWSAPTSNKPLLHFMHYIVLVTTEATLSASTLPDDPAMRVVANTSAVVPPRAHTALERQCKPYYVAVQVVGQDFSQGPQGVYCDASPWEPVYVRDAPAKPTLYHAQQDGSYSVRVSWFRGDSGGCPVTYYAVLYKGKSPLGRRITGVLGDKCGWLLGGGIEDLTSRTLVLLHLWRGGTPKQSLLRVPFWKRGSLYTLLLQLHSFRTTDGYDS